MITEFLHHKLNVEGCAEGTAHEYEKNLRAFATWVNATAPGTGWSGLTVELMNAHVAAMTEAKLKPRAIKLRVSAVRSLLNWLCATGRLKTNPLRYQQTPKPGHQLPKVADLDAVTKFVTAPTASPITLEIQALVALLAETGMRISEATGMRTTDVDKEHRAIRVRGKGNKERVVYYGDMSRAKLNALAGVKNCKFVIFARSQEEYRALMSREMKPYTDYIHPHMLRHAYATHMLEAGASLSAIAANLGHESTRMAERYAHVATTEAARAATALAPRL